MGRDGDRDGDNVEQDHSQLLRGEGAGGFAGLRPPNLFWGGPTGIVRSILLLALIIFAAWWF